MTGINCSGTYTLIPAVRIVLALDDNPVSDIVNSISRARPTIRGVRFHYLIFHVKLKAVKNIQRV